MPLLIDLITTKKILLQSLVLSIASCGSECWVFENTKRKLKLSNFGAKAEKRMLTFNRRKMSFIGHILRSKDITCDPFMGTVLVREEEKG